MPATLITQYLAALHNNDHDAITRIEQEAADYDKHNPFGPRLADEIRGLHQPAAT